MILAEGKRLQIRVKCKRCKKLKIKIEEKIITTCKIFWIDKKKLAM